jgi:hypothetical protein
VNRRVPLQPRANVTVGRNQVALDNELDKEFIQRQKEYLGKYGIYALREELNKHHNTKNLHII